MNTLKDILVKRKELKREGEFSTLYVDYHAVMDIAFNSKNPSSAIKSLLNLASLALSSNQSNRAWDYYKKALYVAQESETPTLAIQPLLGLASMSLNIKDDHQARVYYRKALCIAQESYDEKFQLDVLNFNMY